MKRGPHNPLSTGKLYRAIKELIANAAVDRELALQVFHEAKASANIAVETAELDSLRKLMIEALKLAQSSKASNIKAIELYIKNQEAMFNNMGEEASRATEEGFLGD